MNTFADVVDFSDKLGQTKEEEEKFNDYNRGITLIENKKFEKGIEVLSELGDYKDAITIIESYNSMKDSQFIGVWKTTERVVTGSYYTLILDFRLRYSAGRFELFVEKTILSDGFDMMDPYTTWFTEKEVVNADKLSSRQYTWSIEDGRLKEIDNGSVLYYDKE